MSPVASEDFIYFQPSRVQRYVLLGKTVSWHVKMWKLRCFTKTVA